MKELVKVAVHNQLKAVAEKFLLEDVNEVLAKLKESEIPMWAVLVP